MTESRDTSSSLTLTELEFEYITGRKPEQDDLERVNCDKAGQMGHMSCGWCARCNGPMFVCDHRVIDMARKSRESLVGSGEREAFMAGYKVSCYESFPDVFFDDRDFNTNNLERAYKEWKRGE